ncbi:hypothetical protein TRVA0_035S01508 [Trichomonascus vanleenenianus]|uniref:uncharacterized protein n=1 Tax=Trichomonascus vanleenenianus TaxID=2268995 RepID=UPI003ECAE1D4
MMKSDSDCGTLSVEERSVSEVVVSVDENGDRVLTEEEQKKLDKIYRKLDWHIIPALWCLYFLTSFGGAAYGNALTMNQNVGHSIIEKLNLTSHDISTANALDYVGYIIFDVPMNLIMTRVAAQAWLSRIVVTVGIVYTFYAALTNAGGLIVLRLMTGLATAGAWPGMAYYISLWYPGHRTARRIGYYFTAAQISAAVAGLVAAGFQKMDGMRGLVGFQWMFLVYGLVTIVVGVSLNWWLPDRPKFQPQVEPKNWILRIFLSMSPRSPREVLTPEEAELHALDMKLQSKSIAWGLKDFVRILVDPRLYPLVIMYFGVVGVGYGIVVFASKIIYNINPGLSPIDLSLLTAPIWLCDLVAIVLITPFSDKFKRHRGIVFSLSTVIIIVGLVVTTYAPGDWSRYGGLLICGFGLGPTVPICMTWAAEIFGPRHGDIGTAASAAAVSGLGNLGSVTTTYALYSGWPADVGYVKSNMVMVAILGISILAAGSCTGLRYILGDFKRNASKN